MKKTGGSFIVARRISRHMLRLYMVVYLSSLLAIAVIFVPRVYRTSYNNCLNTITDIASNIEEVQSQMASAASNLTYSEIIEEMLFSDAFDSEARKKPVIELALDTFMEHNPSVLAIRILTGDGREYYPIFSYKYDLPALLDGDADYRALLTRSQSSYYGPLIEDVFDATGMKYDAFSYSLTKSAAGGKYTATVFYNANSCLSINRRLLSRTMDNCTILSRGGGVVYATDPQAAQALADDPPSYDARITGATRARGGVCFYSMATASGWRIVCCASYITLARDALIILAAIMVLSLIAPLTYSYFLKQAVTSELTPIKRLSGIMSGFEIGQSVQTDIRTGDEIQDMCEAFNGMVGTINRQAAEISAREKQNAMTLYRLLVTQIDPHFIYNTMNVINIMARSGDTDAIVEINSALIKILRERLSVKLSTVNTLEEEIDTLEQYNLIMRYRFGNRINTYISVAPELLKVSIPKNILQPLVENALYHGYDTAGQRALDVDIMIYSQDGNIIIELSDNGKGMTAERLEQVRRNATELYSDDKPHIGIDNIRQRLAFLYGDAARMEINSEVNAGTNIVITFPMDGGDGDAAA